MEQWFVELRSFNKELIGIVNFCVHVKWKQDERVEEKKGREERERGKKIETRRRLRWWWWWRRDDDKTKTKNNSWDETSTKHNNEPRKWHWCRLCLGKARKSILIWNSNMENLFSSNWTDILWWCCWWKWRTLCIFASTRSLNGDRFRRVTKHQHHHR